MTTVQLSLLITIVMTAILFIALFWRPSLPEVWAMPLGGEEKDKMFRVLMDLDVEYFPDPDRIYCCIDYGSTLFPDGYFICSRYDEDSMLFGRGWRFEDQFGGELSAKEVYELAHAKRQR